LLAALAEVIQKEKTAEVQIWYVADSSWKSIDPSNVTINDIYINKACKVDSYGDLNADKKVDITDMTIMSLYILGDVKLEESTVKYADVNGDGNTNIADLAHLKQYVMKDPVTLGPKK